MEENLNKSYFAVIPANVRYSKKLNSSAKLLYAEISALCNEKGYCWATNQYFADLYDTSKSTISHLISKLANENFIKVYLEYGEDGGIKSRKIYITNQIEESPLQVQEMPEKVISITSEDIKNFDEFYSAYPRQEGKNKALMAYKNALKRGASHKEIMDGVGRYTNYVADNNIDPLFVKLPATFLLNQDFKNEYKVQSIMDGIIK